MGNMSYCRFENTLRDLRDCWDHIDEREMSIEESKARAALIKICKDIAEYAEDNEE